MIGNVIQFADYRHLRASRMLPAVEISFDAMRLTFLLAAISFSIGAHLCELAAVRYTKK